MFDLFNFAYLDPSTGSIVIQSLIGIVAGVTVFGRNAIHQVAGKTRRLFSRTEESGAKTEAKTEQR